MTEVVSRDRRLARMAAGWPGGAGRVSVSATGLAVRVGRQRVVGIEIILRVAKKTPLGVRLGWAGLGCGLWAVLGRRAAFACTQSICHGRFFFS